MSPGDTFEYCGRRWTIISVDRWGIKVMPDCGGETYEIAECDNCGAEGPAKYLRSGPPVTGGER